jgi:hypothetical protein
MAQRTKVTSPAPSLRKTQEVSLTEKIRIHWHSFLRQRRRQKISPVTLG